MKRIGNIYHRICSVENLHLADQKARKGKSSQPGHTRIRKRNKKSFARAVARKASAPTIASYLGWAKHADARHLIKKLNIQLSNHKNQNINESTSIH